MQVVTLNAIGEVFANGINSSDGFTRDILLDTQIKLIEKAVTIEHGMHSVHQLASALREHEDVCAVQIWQRDDVKTALAAEGFEATDEQIAAIMKAAKKPLEDCSDGWEKLDVIVRDTVKNDNSPR